jgi:branched-chain amino acid transport system substrate-binding protein
MGSKNSLFASACVAAALLTPSFAAENIRMAFIDPLSGPFSPIGQSLLQHWRMMADYANGEKWASGHSFEVSGFDNKGSPQEALVQLRTAIDQGYRYIIQGAGSGVALALNDAISKYNERNPGKEVIFLNYAANDPDLTNGKCSFWHFRLDANSDMKMEVLTSVLAKDKSVGKVYLINQNFAFGHQVARAAKEYLKRKRADIQIVGDDLHPIGQVKDFSPYVAKMKAAGADTVITGNFGADLALLIKAAKDADFNANFYTIYGATSGVPSAMGSAGAERVKFVGYWHPNNEGFAGKHIVEEYKKKYNDDYTGIATYSGMTMLAMAINKAKSTDPVKVAFAMEDLKFKSLNGEFSMRAADHQAQQPIYVATWAKVNNKDVKYDQENTGYGWRTDVKVDSYVAAQPTSCQMKRPAR